jgi:hypothetical protein
MIKRCFISLTCIWFFICLIAAAQQSPTRYEYGSAAELKGVTKIYIYTGTELEVRNNIIKTIRSTLKNIVVTDRPEDAEVVLSFAADTNTFLATIRHSSATTTTGTVIGQSQTNGNITTGQGTYVGRSTTTGSSTPIYRTVVTGMGLVARLTDNDTIRLLMDFKDSRSTIFERRPSTNFARAFVKAHQEANGMKK